MAFRITVDPQACQGYANCLIEGPALFDINDDTNVAVVLGGDEHDETLRDHAVAAQQGCPAHAILIEPL